MLGCPTSHVICICHMTQRPDDEMGSWSVGRLTNAYDMGRWTSQHLTAAGTTGRDSVRVEVSVAFDPQRKRSYVLEPNAFRPARIFSRVIGCSRIRTPQAL